MSSERQRCRSSSRGRGRCLRAVLAPLFGSAFVACGGAGRGEPVRIHVPVGASFGQVTDSLAQHDIIDAPAVFELYARIRGASRGVKPGTYAFRRGTSWNRVLGDLNAGRVLNVRLVIPEGWDLRGIAPRIAEVTGLQPDTVLRLLFDTTVARRFNVPGPTLEGYLYPATYTFPIDTPLDTVIDRLVEAYDHVWTPERRARAKEIGMNERQVVTLASIVEKEARQRQEMPVISAVYHNRLRLRYRLDADPTVQYALGVHQKRLLYAHIESVADHPYNTYRQYGLPPGPIASPSALGIDAALNPADVDFLYFVARPDGSHIFTRSLAEHNRARVAVQRMQPAGTGATPRRAPPTRPPTRP